MTSEIFMAFDDEESQLIDNLAVATDNDSHASVVRNALVVYADVVKASLAGDIILLKKPNGETEPFHLHPL